MHTVIFTLVADVVTFAPKGMALHCRICRCRAYTHTPFVLLLLFEAVCSYKVNWLLLCSKCLRYFASAKLLMILLWIFFYSHIFFLIRAYSFLMEITRISSATDRRIIVGQFEPLTGDDNIQLALNNSTIIVIIIIMENNINVTHTDTHTTRWRRHCLLTAPLRNVPHCYWLPPFHNDGIWIYWIQQKPKWS